MCCEIFYIFKTNGLRNRKNWLHLSIYCPFKLFLFHSQDVAYKSCIWRDRAISKGGPAIRFENLKSKIWEICHQDNFTLFMQWHKIWRLLFGDFLGLSFYLWNTGLVTGMVTPPHSRKNEVILCISKKQPVNYNSVAIPWQNTIWLVFRDAYKYLNLVCNKTHLII